MKRLTGVPASPGFAVGKALLHEENDLPEIKRLPIAKTGLEAEVKRFETALYSALDELKFLLKKAEAKMSREQAAIFSAQLLMLEDPDFIDQVSGRIKNKLDNAEWAVWETGRTFAEMIAAAPDPVLRERAADINDVSRRVLRRLLSINKTSLADLSEDAIITAHDLLPSEILTINKAHVKGIVMDMGSRTSHTAIIARAFNIPAALGLSDAVQKIKTGDTLIVDGETGEVFINPEKKIFDKYQKAESLREKNQADDLSIKDLPAETSDGHRVLLKANIGTPDEALQTLNFGAEGIGLYRSEFLFLVPGSAPGEEEQFEAYGKVLKVMGQLPVTIRTVDLGGDKILPGFQGSGDANPLLGWRGIRFSLAQPDLFKTQLRALLRAGVNGKLRIMFPLVSGIEELEKSLALFEEAKEECRKKGQNTARNVETGVMIEVPSAALTADILAEKAGFFSIGTNDLIQYSLAVDRGNERVNYLAQPCHPAVIRLLKNTIDAAHKRGIKAALCGEMAGDPLYTPLLLGLGLDEFSMTASSIPHVKKIIRGVTLVECRNLAEKILSGSSHTGNTALLNNWTKEYTG